MKKYQICYHCNKPIGKTAKKGRHHIFGRLVSNITAPVHQSCEREYHLKEACEMQKIRDSINQTRYEIFKLMGGKIQ